MILKKANFINEFLTFCKIWLLVAPMSPYLYNIVLHHLSGDTCKNLFQNLLKVGKFVFLWNYGKRAISISDSISFIGSCIVFYAQRGDVQFTTVHTARMTAVVGARARTWLSPPTCAGAFRPTGLWAIGVRVDNPVYTLRAKSW